jgi:hypothetical protein
MIDCEHQDGLTKLSSPHNEDEGLLLGDLLMHRFSRALIEDDSRNGGVTSGDPIQKLDDVPDLRSAADVVARAVRTA